MTEPMTDERLKEIESCNFYNESGNIRRQLLLLTCEEIRRLREENERAKTEFPNSVEINRELGVRVRQLREENANLRKVVEATEKKLRLWYQSEDADADYILGVAEDLVEKVS
jgi:hypothetical protein